MPSDTPLRFAARMQTARRSFVREILKVTERPDIISFAGGLPNPALFPVAEIAESMQKVLAEDGTTAVQYSTTEGYLPLRRYIADRYRKTQGLDADPDDILIVNGSQQALDLLGAIFIDKNDAVVLERPGYLGAIQAFGMYQPRFAQVPLTDRGIDTAALERTLGAAPAKILYTVPNFQNPSGITYDEPTRRAVARIAAARGVVFVEDDPYGAIRFMGADLPMVKSFTGDAGVALGTFSKTVAPGLRIGWIWAPRPIMDKLVTAKQAADLHTSTFAQMAVYRHLADHDLDAHLDTVRAAYRVQRDAMVHAIERYFPAGVSCTRPEGGMFLWVTLPEGIAARDLLQDALKEHVAFVPGDAFYTEEISANTLRLNYSNADEGKITEGIRRLGTVIERSLKKQGMPC